MRRSTKKKIVYPIILVLLCVFYSCCYNMLKWKIDNKKLAKEVNKIVETYPVYEVEDSHDAVFIAPEEEEPTDYYFDFIKQNFIDVDIKKLQNEYDNVKGWIRVEGTNVNYPFVQTNDNDYYLYHSIEKKYNAAGWIFLDYRNNGIGSDNNTILFGHGRRNQTMFGSLNNILLDNNWLNNKDNYVIKISTEEENSLWQIFSAYHLPTTTDYLNIEFASDEKYQEFIDLITSRTMFDFHASANINDKILTLSTCYNDDDEKMVIHAKLIKKDIRN